MNKIVVLLFFGVLVVSGSGGAWAQGSWYVGAESGWERSSFQTRYNYAVGGQDTFDNHADHWGAGIVAGREFSVLNTLGLAVQGRLSRNASTWQLDTVDEYLGTNRGGPSHLEYRIPYEYSLSVVPKVGLFRNFWLTGEVGVGQGIVRLRKDSASSTRYDFDHRQTAFTLGGGVMLRVSRLLDLYAAYRHTSYGRADYTGTFADGLKWESITTEARSHSAVVGIQFRLSKLIP